MSLHPLHTGEVPSNLPCHVCLRFFNFQISQCCVIQIKSRLMLNQQLDVKHAVTWSWVLVHRAHNENYYLY